MKKKSRIMLEKAINSLLLTIEHFNSPWEKGRKEITLIALDHSFEMILKASILEFGGNIMIPRKQQAIGFDKCVRIALTGSSKIKPFISQEKALTIQTINGLRDAAQHHILDISEEHLYLMTQSGVTLFADILERVFKKSLRDYLPSRVLPVSTIPPKDIKYLIENELKYVRYLLSPRKRKKVEARARIKSLVIMDKALQGEFTQPGDNELDRILSRLKKGESWKNVFTGLGSIRVSANFDEDSLTMNIKWTKKEGIPIHTVPEGTPGAAVVAIKRVNELGYYSLSLTDLSKKIGLTMPKALAVVKALDIQSESQYFKSFKIGKSVFKRYSPRALDFIKKQLPYLDIKRVWKKHRPKPRKT